MIFCRNVLIYFDRATQDRAIVVLNRLLKPHGVLFVAPAETGLPRAMTWSRRMNRWPVRFAKAAVSARAEPGSRPSAASIRQPAARPLCRCARPAQPVPREHCPRTAVARETAADIGEAQRLADQGHFVEAAACCEEHLRRQALLRRRFIFMGLVRDATGNEAEAVAYYRKAFYLDPNHMDANPPGVSDGEARRHRGRKGAARRTRRLEHNAGPS